MKKQAYTYREGLHDGVPIALGYLSVSFGFGISVVSKGLSWVVALIISLTNETSAGQLAGLGVIAASGSLIEIALTQLVINIRYALMGISLSQRVDGSFTTPWRMLLSFSITDEIFAVASLKKEKIGNRYFGGLCTLPYIGWALGTLLGAVAGNLLPSLISGALGIMLYGMFLAIIVPPARKEKGVLLAVLVAVACSVAFRYLPFFGFLSGGFALILSAAIGAVVASVFCPVPGEDESEASDGGKGVSA